MKPSVTDAHLYPFTLAFQRGLQDGTVTLDNALEFCNRTFDAYLEACVDRRANKSGDYIAPTVVAVITGKGPPPE